MAVKDAVQEEEDEEKEEGEDGGDDREEIERKRELGGMAMCLSTKRTLIKQCLKTILCYVSEWTESK